MVRPVRMSIIAVAAVLVLFTLPIDVSAKKKSSKRKSRAARSASVVFMAPVQRSVPVVVTPPTLSPPVADDIFFIKAAPEQAAKQVAPPASSAPTTGSGSGTPAPGDSAGKGGNPWTTRPNIRAAGSLVISEFRVRGPSGANDEFIEIYNDFGAPHTVADSGAGSGYAIVASDGTARCVIPNGTVIPSGGHFLCTNSVSYSLAGYAAGNLTYTTDIPDNAGIALFNTSVAANFTLANRFDAVGSTGEANTLYKEGTGYPNLTPFLIDYAWMRDECGKQGSIPTMGPCPFSTPIDTDNNATNFVFFDTNGTSAGAGQRLGAPGPQNLSSPIQRNSFITENLIDGTIAKNSSPNRVRDFTSDPGNNSNFGTIAIRRRFVNNTGAPVTRLRFRVIDMTTFPAPSGFADLRLRTSTNVLVTVNDSATCSPAPPSCSVTALATTLEQPPSQPNGGGFNSSLAAGTVTPGTPLANGAGIKLNFLLGIQQTGSFKIYVNIEALP